MTEEGMQIFEAGAYCTGHGMPGETRGQIKIPGTRPAVFLQQDWHSVM